MGTDPRVADQANPADFSFVFDPETRTAKLAYHKGLSSNEVRASISFSDDLTAPWTDQTELDFNIQKQRVGDLVEVLMTLDEDAQAKPRYFARMVLEWVGGTVGNPLLAYPFTGGSPSAGAVQPGIAPLSFDVRTSAFPAGVSGFSASNDTTFMRSTQTGENLQAAIAQGDYHQVEIDFTGRPTDLVSLEFEHKASTDLAFISHIAVFASTDGFATPPVPGDAIGVSTVEVPAGQSPLISLQTAVFSLFGPQEFNPFSGSLSLRFYYFDDTDNNSRIHRLDTLRLYGF